MPFGEHESGDPVAPMQYLLLMELLKPGRQQTLHEAYFVEISPLGVYTYSAGVTKLSCGDTCQMWIKQELNNVLTKMEKINGGN